MPNANITTAKLAKLRQKAEAAENCSPSPWVFREMPSVKDEVRDSENFQVAGWFTLRWQAEYIAEADPATVLAMVEEIEQLRKLQCWVIMQKDNRDQVFDGPFFSQEEAWSHLPESIDHEYTVEPWVNQANVKESEATQ